MQDIPDKLCQLRDLTGLSQFQLSFFFGVSQAAYSKWESGRHVPRDKHVEAITRFYQVPRIDFMHGETERLVALVFTSGVLKVMRGRKRRWIPGN